MVADYTVLCMMPVSLLVVHAAEFLDSCRFSLCPTSGDTPVAPQ